jgi:hypothetical protein
MNQTVKIQQCLRILVNFLPGFYDFTTPKHIIGYYEAPGPNFFEY